MAVLSSSDRSRSRNSGRGSHPSAASMRAGVHARSGMAALHSRAQRLQRAELQLLDGAFGPAEPRRDVAHAPLMREAFDDDGALRRGQLVDVPEEPRVIFE